MRIAGLRIVLLTLVALTACDQGHYRVKMQSSEEPPFNGEVQILHAWHGDYPVAGLDQFPEDQRHNPFGFIDDPETFLTVWTIFRPGEAAPDIDFKTHLVIFARNTQFYNRLTIGKIKVNNGIAEVLAMETRSARPIEKQVAISLVVVARQGITGLDSGGNIVRLPDISFYMSK